MNNKTFEYGGYHFTPERTFDKDEDDFLKISRHLSIDKNLGLCEAGYVYDSNYPYSYDEFYEASTDKKCDLFRCDENGKLYIPCEHDLQRYSEEKLKTFKVTIKETLKRVVEVKAEDYEEAINSAQSDYSRGDIVLNSDDYTETEFTAEEVLSEKENSVRKQRDNSR